MVLCKTNIHPREWKQKGGLGNEGMRGGKCIKNVPKRNCMKKGIKTEKVRNYTEVSG